MKKKITFFKSFEEMNDHKLNQQIHSSLQDRWDAFWKLKKFHEQFFPMENAAKPEKQSRKGLIISKPEWI